MSLRLGEFVLREHVTLFKGRGRDAFLQLQPGLKVWLSAAEMEGFRGFLNGTDEYVR